MRSYNETWAQLCSDGALINSGGRQFTVARRDNEAALAGCPMHMLLGALGACIVLTVNAVAEHKQIDLKDLKVRLDYQQDDRGATRFDVDLSLGSALTDRERKILYQSARLCEVGKLLKSDVHIDYRLKNAEVAS